VKTTLKPQSRQRTTDIEQGPCLPGNSTVCRVAIDYGRRRCDSELFRTMRTARSNYLCEKSTPAGLIYRALPRACKVIESTGFEYDLPHMWTSAIQ